MGGHQPHLGWKMNYEDEYKRETGRSPHISTCLECGNYDKEFIEWLKSRCDLEHRRRVAAENAWKNYGLSDYGDYLEIWQSIIAESEGGE